MVNRIRQGGPDFAHRPFMPQPGLTDAADQKSEALDHIARALSGIDTHLQQLVHVMKMQNEILGKMLVKR